MVCRSRFAYTQFLIWIIYEDETKIQVFLAFLLCKSLFIYFDSDLNNNKKNHSKSVSTWFMKYLVFLHQILDSASLKPGSTLLRISIYYLPYFTLFLDKDMPLLWLNHIYPKDNDFLNPQYPQMRYYFEIEHLHMFKLRSLEWPWYRMIDALITEQSWTYKHNVWMILLPAMKHQRC